MLIDEVTVRIGFWSPIILLAIGVPASCLNTIIFMGTKTFRRSPLAYYIVAQSLADISVLLILFFQIIPSTSVSVSSFSCKLGAFGIQVAVCTAMSFLCLSAFDRWACTSQSAEIRKWSSIHVARGVFFVPFIFWPIINSPFIIYCDLIPPLFTCWFTNELFAQIGVLILTPILTVLLPVSILIMLGLLTYRNIRLVTRFRQQPNLNRQSRWEHQMARMMLVQTLTSVLCILPRAAFNIFVITTLSQSATRTLEETSIVLFINQLSVSIASLNYASSFYIFLLVSPRFRQTFKMYVTCTCIDRHRQIGTANMVPTVSIHVA